MRVFAILFITLFLLPGHAFAWGDEGHQIVCEIAYRLATVDTRAAIRKLVRNDQEYDTFSEACVFPDHPRKRASEHFINLPRTAHELPPEGCPGGTPCALNAIENDSAVLGSKGKPADRLIALKSLGHWVGDIHQPLHVSFADDKGGNGIDVSGQCSGVLHATWDTCLVVKAVGTDVSAAASDLIDTLTAAMKEEWVQSEPRDWANESFAISEDVKTHYCVMQAGACTKADGAQVEIDHAYIATNTPIVRERLLKAGVRLAHLLDKLFAD
ncbi:S1/P1 nuclease [Bradyrhizobium liaoningense]|uniref:S1/P1 nuclease n=1 Tax=Bradyrhizobium liaoningense TaxID=43992 RepID=UPI001BA4CDEE|nr:S1/P1 nuclease [Bradyrhizobium liaoningense]MBR1029381.1 S1/P1 nuclease [Bradyrhizobium liaoningense]